MRRVAFSFKDFRRIFGTAFFALLFATLMLSGCESNQSKPVEPASRSGRVNVAASVTPTTPLSTAADVLPSEACAIVAVEGGTAVLDRASKDCLRLQVRDTVGRPMSNSVFAMLEIEAPTTANADSRIRAFVPAPEGNAQWCQLAAPLADDTSATLHLWNTGDGAVESYAVRLRCAKDSAVPPLASDVFTSGSVYARLLGQAVACLENFSADAPARVGPALAFLQNYLMGLPAAAGNSDVVKELVGEVRRARARAAEKGTLPEDAFEQLRARMQSAAGRLQRP